MKKKKIPKYCVNAKPASQYADIQEDVLYIDEVLNEI